MECSKATIWTAVATVFLIGGLAGVGLLFIVPNGKPGRFWTWFRSDSLLRPSNLSAPQSAMVYRSHWLTNASMCYVTGQWVYTHRVKPYQLGPDSVTRYECPINLDAPRPNQHGWEWQPQCPLPEWETESFCKALGNRHLLLVGDSMMRVFALTMASLLHIRQPIRPISINGTSKDKFISTTAKFRDVTAVPEEISFRVCGGRLLLLYCAFFHFDLASPCFVKALQKTGYRFLIVMMVATRYNEAPKHRSHFKWEVKTKLTPFMEQNQNHSVVFLTTPAGVPNCSLYHAPVQQLPSRNASIHVYHWELLHEVRDLALELLPNIGIPVLDSFRFMTLRPDLHPRRFGKKNGRRFWYTDCLHFCVASTPNTELAQILFAMLPQYLDNSVSASSSLSKLR